MNQGFLGQTAGDGTLHRIRAMMSDVYMLCVNADVCCDKQCKHVF